MSTERKDIADLLKEVDVVTEGLAQLSTSRRPDAELLEQIAEEFDLQTITEVVGDRKEVTLLIQDGEVAEDRTKAAPTEAA